jgi:hypothetical protein
MAIEVRGIGEQKLFNIGSWTWKANQNNGSRKWSQPQQISRPWK